MKPTLVLPKEEFKAVLQSRIGEGKVILADFVGIVEKGQHYFEALEKRFRMWNSFNKEWLEHAFNQVPNEHSQKYINTGNSRQVEKLTIASRGGNPNSVEFRVRFFQDEVTPKIENLEDLLARLELIPEEAPPHLAALPITSLTYLHPVVQSTSTSLFDNGYYRQAVLDACIALDRTVQAQAQLPATTIGTALMTKVFSANNPLIRLSTDPNEQMGFMNLYQGSVQAIRNHYGHNLTEITDPARALEWLGFVSALFYKLDDALPVASTTTTP